MKIAMSSYSGFGSWLATMLRIAGHKVDYYVSRPEFANILGGIAPAPFVKFHDHRQKDENIGYPDYSKYDLSLFDLTGRERQAMFSADRTPTIGDGYINKMLEEDRLFGIQIMEQSGIEVPQYETFTDVSAAKSFIKETKGRYVYKPFGGQSQDTATTYISKSDTDLLEYIDKLFILSKASPFILQKYIPGVEISTEAWFNGEDFYLINCTLEEKKFMNGGVGPNTGCAGNLVFTISPEARVFREGLARARKILNTMDYHGMLDLNTIATDDKLYGLEWTPRFGYDASPTLFNMYSGDLGELFHRIATGGVPESSWRAEYGAAVRVTIPPYPTEYRAPKLKGVPIRGFNLDSDEEFASTWFYDVMMDKKDLVCTGANGLICAPITTANNAGEAFDKLEDRLKYYNIPDAQYRTDLKSSIGKRLIKLREMNWL